MTAPPATATALATASAPAPATSTTPLRVYAAGSLRSALTDIAQRYEAQTGTAVALTFGASGLLRAQIEKGESAQVFASVDTQHPAALAAASGDWQTPTRFVRNRLCAISQPALAAVADTLLALMMDPLVKVGMSTPGFDPAGDYAWALSHRAEAVQPGAYAVLSAKALKLTGSPAAPTPPAGQGAYHWLMATGQADVFLTCCTNAAAVVREVPQLQRVALPAALEVGADDAVTGRTGDANAQRFVRYLLAAPAQAIFARFGFGAP